MSLCENQCIFTGYEPDTKKAKCECDVKSKQLVISELINQTDILDHNFTSKEESTNMITMKCVHTLFSKSGLAKNIGSYILIFNFTLVLILGIAFYKCGYPFLEDTINAIIHSRQQKKEKTKGNKKDIDLNRKETSGNKNVVSHKIKKSNPGKKIKKSKGKNKKKKKKYKRGKNLNLVKSNFIDSNSKSIVELKSSKIINITPLNIQINLKSNNAKKNSDYIDYELNSMVYKDALKYDKRSCCDFYIYLIRIKNYILFSFCPIKDYNSIVIKITLFFVFFSICYFINALFFDEPTIHQIYEEKGFYNFIYLVPHIFGSFAISYSLNTIIKFIFLSERNIIQIKREKNINRMYDIIDKVKKRLIIKYIIFYCVSAAFLLFFWYYLSSFGAVYQNTQIYLIKNTAISFGTSLAFPFIFSLIPAMIRSCALKGRSNECLYKISKILHFI